MPGIGAIDLATLQGLGKTVARDADEKSALKAFEAYFLGEMLKLSAPQNPTGLFDGGQAGRMYQDQLYEELARLIAERGDFGLARSLEGHLDATDASEDETDGADAVPHEDESKGLDRAGSGKTEGA